MMLYQYSPSLLSKREEDAKKEEREFKKKKTSKNLPQFSSVHLTLSVANPHVVSRTHALPSLPLWLIFVSVML